MVAGTRVPSTRTLAAQLGVARGTVINAYAQLAAEGWLCSRQGAPTTIAMVAAGANVRALRPVQASATTFLHSLRPGTPDLSLFPFPAWVAGLNKVVQRGLPSCLDYNAPEGSIELRRALSGYLERARGVVAEPDHLAICPSATEVLASVATAVAPGEIAMEDPGFPRHREVVAAAGAHVVPLPVDDQGAIGDPGPVAAAVVTPAHQFPLGTSASPARRNALVGWARSTGGLVVEDDYDGEFRFDREPIGAVQGLSPDDVLYVGTTSKSLAPGLRVAWAVLPSRFAEAFKARLHSPAVPNLDQLALAELIESGGFDRHLRRCRAVYRRRRDELVKAVEAIDRGLVVRGVAAGLHAVVELPDNAPSEEAVVAEAARLSLELWPIGPCWQTSPHPKGLIVGYSYPPTHAWPAALEALCKVLRWSVDGPGVANGHVPTTQKSR